jgi:hypothetical protein
MTGKVNDTNKDLWVGGVQVVVSADGTWEADGVLMDDRSGSQQ